MLQQTRVETVIPYFERFLETFPTVDDLGRARLEDVLRLWAGLGYYSRARSLLAAAQTVVKLGAFPSTEEGLRRLPGFGPYTAAAVASIACGQDAFAADGNAGRVLCRLYGISADPRSLQGRRAVLEAGRNLLPSGQAGDFNQALMDLGAMICTPREPACSDCPLAEACVARSGGLVGILPTRAPRRPATVVHALAARIEVEGRLLLVRRPPRGLLGGLWDLPGGPRLLGEPVEDGLRRHLLEQVGLVGRPLWRIGALRHLFTHMRWEAEVWRMEPEGPLWGGSLESTFVTAEQLALKPISRLAAKAIALGTFFGPSPS
jgi:A/G-specific adenine glycosylase